MNLGMYKDEVKLVPYTAEWSEEFQRVKKQILFSTGLETGRVEHIGSTAIVDMPSKPIIDIVVGVEDINALDKDFFKAMHSVGFLRLRVERPKEIVLARFKDELYEIKTHFVHLVKYKGEHWRNLIFFRDYLNIHEHEKKEYMELKEELSKRGNIIINNYTNLKESFVKSLIAKRRSSNDN